jgi:hypothetical protein
MCHFCINSQVINYKEGIHMKKLLLVGMITLLAFGLSYAGGERMTNQGTHSLNFLMNGLGTFGVSGFPSGSSNGSWMYGFGGSYFVATDMAIRAGVAFNRWNENQTTTGGETDETFLQFGIAPALLWYCVGEGAVSGYWGPTVMFGMSSDENKFTPTSGTGSSSKQTYTDFGFGFVMGAQWWAWSQVAFNAEYVLAYNTSSSKFESGGSSTDGPTETFIGIYSWSVGLALFFAR